MECKQGLEKRMYFLVPYNISEIQKGIQAGHAALKYVRKYTSFSPDVWDFIDNHETWIILNGGTTNKTKTFIDYSGLYKGSLDNYLNDLCLFNIENPNDEINFSYFYEPDLNDALTAICLIVDERVFNRDDYPDFEYWVADTQEIFISADKEEEWNIMYEKFEKEVGKDIAFLKKLLNTKKLA